MHKVYSRFDGEIPRSRPHLLGETAAQIAQNVILENGDLKPLKLPAAIATLAKAGVKKTIYRFGKALDSDTQYWFHNTDDVNYATGPLANDTQERTYFTGDGAPKQTDSVLGTSGALLPSGSYLLGLPAPTTPTVAVSGAATGVATQILVSYCFVTATGEPGPESAVSAEIPYYQGQTLTVSALDTAPAGAYNIGSKRIFVSQPDSTGAQRLKFWRDVLIGVTSTAGVVDFTLLGEGPADPVLIAPPADMFGIMSHPNRFMAGFTKRQILRSEINRPYGWPAEYRDSTSYDIVGGAILGQSIVVVTKGKTLMATGQDPLNQSIIELGGEYPGVSKRSIANITMGVAYACADGIAVAIDAGPVRLLTEGIFTRTQWQAFKPESMHACFHDSRLIVWYDTGTVQGGLIFDMNGLSVTQVRRTTIYATAAYVDERRDELFVALPSDNNLYKWGVGADSVRLYRSREERVLRPQNVGAARVRADSYPVTFRFFGLNNGVTVSDTTTVADDEAFRLPGDARYTHFYWEVEGGGTVSMVEVASTVDSMKGSGNG